MNSWAAVLPMPLAPPVIKATLPSSLLGDKICVRAKLNKQYANTNLCFVLNIALMLTYVFSI
jgi:hypothetical protein